MGSIVIKIIDKKKPDLVEQAIGELEGAGYIISGKREADLLGVDALKIDNGEQTYGPCTIVIGEKQ
jgi:hypothetical protein